MTWVDYRKAYDILPHSWIVDKIELSGKNIIMPVNIWAVATLRHTTSEVDWKADEEKELDRKTRTMMPLHGALRPNSDVGQLYLPKQKG